MEHRKFLWKNNQNRLIRTTNYKIFINSTNANFNVYADLNQKPIYFAHT